MKWLADGHVIRSDVTWEVTSIKIQVTVISSSDEQMARANVGNVLLQMTQIKLFSFVIFDWYLIVCLRKSDGWLKYLSQASHSYDLLSWTIDTCRSRLERCENVFSQMSHKNAFLFLWTISWSFKCHFEWHFLPQCPQL